MRDRTPPKHHHRSAVAVPKRRRCPIRVGGLRLSFALVLLGERVAFVDPSSIAMPFLIVEHRAAQTQPRQASFHSRDFGGRAGDGLTILRRIRQTGALLLPSCLIHFSLSVSPPPPLIAQWSKERDKSGR